MGNGEMKPWLLESFDKQGPVCATPDSFAGFRWEWLKQVKVFCEETTFVRCAEIWTSFISEETACALKDFDKEWRLDEGFWTERKKVADAETERERKEMERAMR